MLINLQFCNYSIRKIDLNNLIQIEFLYQAIHPFKVYNSTDFVAFTELYLHYHNQFYFLKIFLIWTIFKIFIEFVTLLLLFYVLVFWPQPTWDSLLPKQGSNPDPEHWKVMSQPLDHQGSPIATNIKKKLSKKKLHLLAITSLITLSPTLSPNPRVSTDLLSASIGLPPLETFI